MTPYESLPEADWDGKTPLYLTWSDKFFYDAAQLAEYLGDKGVAVGDLKLLICKHPRYVLFNLDDWMEGDLPLERTAVNYLGADRVIAVERAVNDAVAEVYQQIWTSAEVRPTLESLERHLEEQP
jgi:hypothetical protein